MKAQIFAKAHATAKATRLYFNSYREAFAFALKGAYAAAKKYLTGDEIAARVKAVDARVSTVVEGGFIYGCFRGKGKENYKYCFTSREFVFCNSYEAEVAFKKALAQ